ncbi:MAG TPA: energy transducer TonB [Bryobacteraceae bacterium]|nr:energy transducer TonB [Bryobacteraceae bacterium]
MKTFLTVIGLFCSAAMSLQADVRVTMDQALKAATSRVQPEFPATARQMQISGEVEIEVIINPGGEVEAAKALSGNPLLTQPAIRAVSKWKFTPFTVDGSATKAIAVLKFNFKP